MKSKKVQKINPQTKPAKVSIEDETLKNVVKSHTRDISAPKQSVTQPKYHR